MAGVQCLGLWLLGVQEEQIREVLQLSEPQLADVARWCGRYPDIGLEYSLVGGTSAPAGGKAVLAVELSRAQEGDLPPVDATRSVTLMLLDVWVWVWVWVCASNSI